MPEPFKNIFSEKMVKDLASLLKPQDDGFKEKSFVEYVLRDFEALELKARVNRIAEALGEFLPGDFRQNTFMLLKIKDNFPSLRGVIFPAYVAMKGLSQKDFDFSMKALGEFTKGSSSEFGVRPFIQFDLSRALGFMEKWAKSSDTDLRRLSSEGLRPRLPWGGTLWPLVEDPSKVLKILELLLKDKELYVRKSVANNLNDISKDHPDLIVTFIQKHLGNNHLTDWILKRGARTLIKKKDPKILSLFGYLLKEDPKNILQSKSIKVRPKELKIGENIEISYSLEMKKNFTGLMRLECMVDYPLTSKRKSSKLFFIKELELSGVKKVSGKKSLQFKNFSTHTQVPGVHKLKVLLNGVLLEKFSFTLR
ncbi:MAG: DNA alkylation repair protein [Deltaproteobacteria bacterium]|jgi:3-methyladenine DNA glycosylase AlkC|nr:DNA alkylation repair protein [Deltaproteobacteria bacterium]